MRVKTFKNGSIVIEEVPDLPITEPDNAEPVLEPTPEERLEAQVMYTALMTDTLLDMMEE